MNGGWCGWCRSTSPLTQCEQRHRWKAYERNAKNSFNIFLQSKKRFQKVILNTFCCSLFSFFSCMRSLLFNILFWNLYSTFFTRFSWLWWEQCTDFRTQFSCEKHEFLIFKACSTLHKVNDLMPTFQNTQNLWILLIFHI